MILHGKDLIVMVNGTAIAMSKSCDINVDADIIPTASPSDGQWEDGIVGRKSWKITTNHLVSSVASTAAMVGTIVTLRVKISGNNILTEQLQGYAICRTMKATATVGNLAQGSFVWVGKGSLANPTS